MRVERTQHRAFGGIGRLGMVDVVDEEGKAQHVGEENKFLHGKEP